jgi:hypothetical protein
MVDSRSKAIISIVESIEFAAIRSRGCGVFLFGFARVDTPPGCGQTNFAWDHFALPLITRRPLSLFWTQA